MNDSNSNPIEQALNMPWKFWNEFQRVLIYPWARIIFAWHGIGWNRGWKIYGIPIIQKHRQSQMIFGTGLSLRSAERSNPLGINHPVILCTWEKAAVLQVGDNFGMSGGSICAASRITIGNHVIVGANSTILDTDFHPLDPDTRRIYHSNGLAEPVWIGDDVFIGMNCLILKGVRIGQGAVVGAGSVVTQEVPDWAIFAGNPARKIGEVKT